MKSCFRHVCGILIRLTVGGLSVGAVLAREFESGRLLEVNPPPSPPADKIVAIVGPRLIDGRGGPPIDNAVVIVRGPSIVAAGPRTAIPVPAGAEHIDAAGLTLLPGLIDLHLHASFPLDVPGMFLRNGVTSARDPGVPIELYDAVIRGGRKSPRLFLTGPHFDQAPPAHPQNAIVLTGAMEATAAVDRFVDRGATAIKVYFRLPSDLIRATCEAAHARGVPVTAHLELVDADIAIEMGLDGLEHVSSVGTAVAEPAAAEAFRAAVNADNEARHKGRYKLWAGLDLNTPRVKRMVELIAARGVVLSPTLTYFYGGGPASKKPTDENRRGFANMIGFVRLCHEAGAKIVVGSHTMLGVEPGGQALQKEMEFLVEAGLSPMDAIVAATREGAKFLRAERRVGTIEPGKLADLILIEGDPLQDIRAVRNIRRVMLNGRWIEDAPARSP